MAAEITRDPDLEWIEYVRPVGLVVAPVLLKELGLAPSRQTQADTAVIAAHVREDSTKPAFNNPWTFFQDVLGWETKHVAGGPGGPKLPDDFHVRLPDHDTTLTPTWAVAELGAGDKDWQLLVRIEAPGIDPDGRAALEGWEATPHQRFERLLRETGIFAGLLITEKNERKEGEDRYAPELRLIYAPSGETSGYLTFPLRALATVAGRRMLGGLKLLLDSVRLFTDADERRLPMLLRKSREAQAAVSTALAEQVLGALHELLRGLDAAEPKLIRELARIRPGHLYEGLLTVLMRLVFILYSEDRDLLPSRLDGRAREIYETSYSARGLYARLAEDAAINPDTMDERRGGWGRLLSLFRLIHKGHPSHFVQARGGKLFNPDEFPFLEGRADVANPPRVAAISDGCILRILEGLMTLETGATRERVSYRALDVEQIGSVYETVMGFTVETAAGRSLAIKAGKHNRTPVFIDLEKLLALKGTDRIKFVQEDADRSQFSISVSKAMEAARTVAELGAALDQIVDERGSPKKHESSAGTPILQPTGERRRTGSHYTPRTLTAPIVRFALEPAFERLGPNATPEQILDLKVCDPAMGSGAFLVEACRTLAMKVTEAWSRHPEKKPDIPPDEDEELHACRLVAQRCLYGVDRNPLATDLAKLSLWLATLARDHEFTFLDHALKSGDSLVGLSKAQIAAAHWDSSKPGLPLFRRLVTERVTEAMVRRAEIRAAPDETARAVQEARYKSADQRTEEIRLIGDAVIAAFFAAYKGRARETKRAEVENWLSSPQEVSREKLVAMAATLKQLEHPFTPFHWDIEFPEVFDRANPGFDAIVGNPPFAGGKIMPGILGPAYCEFIKTLTSESKGAADLVAYFFRRSFDFLANNGCLGLIATNSLSQTVSRRVGLEPIIRSGGRIYEVQKDLSWPGDAAVVVTRIHIRKGEPARCVLDGRQVNTIPATLALGVDVSSAQKLRRKIPYSSGVVLYGDSFILEQAQLAEFLPRNPGLRTWLRKYVNGKILNETPLAESDLFVVDFGETPKSMIEGCNDFLQWLMPRVSAERANQTRQIHEKRAWLHWDKRVAFFATTRRNRQVLVCATPSTYLAFRLVDSEKFFMQDVVVFADQRPGFFAAMQSRIHETWAHATAGTLKRDIRYSTSNTFATFPLPSEESDAVALAGVHYHACRDELMTKFGVGLTCAYTRFHDGEDYEPEIRKLRELHAGMDRAVLEAYGWRDLAARAVPLFLDESNEDDHTYRDRLFWPSDVRHEVLARLLSLNAELRTEEVRLGIAPTLKGKTENEDDENNAED